jgi:hypothetical protein
VTKPTSYSLTREDISLIFDRWQVKDSSNPDTPNKQVSSEESMLYAENATDEFIRIMKEIKKMKPVFNFKGGI